MNLHTTPTVIEFGRFQILRHRRELLADGRPVVLGGRAFDLLLALIDAHGEPLSKDDLIAAVWPNRAVDDSALQMQISALRKALAGDHDLIRTIAGRGYQFTGEIGAGSSRSEAAHTPNNLSGNLAELIGRETQLAELTARMGSQRMVTLVGAGGIGKTRLGLEAARNLLPRFADGVWVAELAPLSDPELLPHVVAEAIGITFAGGSVSAERIAATLGTKHALVVLDNCEHVIDAAARMTEALLRASSTVCVMATSRETLRAEGESLYWVPPLDLPAEDLVDARDLLQSGAVQLFLARAQAADSAFAPDARTLMLVAAICRRLDGIPLAIELAAARAAALGVDGLAAHLDDRFKLLSGGHRTALPRHQTLRATLDWSHDLLADVERTVLRRLTVFAGSFALEAASVIAAADDIDALAVIDSIASLTVKSLVTVALGVVGKRYRLLETTRVYARERLTESGELETFARNHARYYRARFEQARSEWETRPTAQWLSAYRPDVDNGRAALDWAFSPSGDAALGVALTVAAVPLWFQLKLIDECRRRVELSLAALARDPAPDAHAKMQLESALAWSLMYTAGHGPEARAAWQRAFEAAEALHDTDYALRALWGLWTGRLNNGEFATAREIAEQFRVCAERSADHQDVLIGERLLGVTLHFLGDQAGARSRLSHMLERYVTPPQRSPVVRFQLDQRVAARITLARAHWLQGFAEQAAQMLEDTIHDALALNHTHSLCNALAEAACPVALLSGDLEAAARYIGMFLQYTVRQTTDLARDDERGQLTGVRAREAGYGRCFRGMLLIRQGDVNNGVRLLGDAIDRLRAARYVQYLTAFLAALGEGLTLLGRGAEAATALAEARDRCAETGERWCVPELLRLQGELAVAAGAADTAEQLFLEALAQAQLQSALAWELRAGMSLARLWHGQGRAQEARSRIASIYDRFSEGHATADLTAARAFLEQS